MKNFYKTIVVTPANEFLLTRFPRIIIVEHSKNGRLIQDADRIYITKGDDELISDENFQYLCGNLANLVLEKAYKNSDTV